MTVTLHMPQCRPRQCGSGADSRMPDAALFGPNWTPAKVRGELAERIPLKLVIYINYIYLLYRIYCNALFRPLWIGGLDAFDAGGRRQDAGGRRQATIALPSKHEFVCGVAQAAQGGRADQLVRREGRALPLEVEVRCQDRGRSFVAISNHVVKVLVLGWAERFQPDLRANPAKRSLGDRHHLRSLVVGVVLRTKMLPNCRAIGQAQYCAIQSEQSKGVKRISVRFFSAPRAR